MHSHILPGIDDGAGTGNMTMQMIRRARDEGVRYICATPHADVRRHGEAYVRKIVDTYKKTRQLLKKHFPDMELYLGNEILYFPGMVKAIREHRALSLNGSRYVLVEYLPSETYPHVLTSVRELAIEGYTPVIAHIERVDCLWKQWDRLDELKQNYTVFQMNTQSLMGNSMTPYVRQCRKLVQEGYIDILGTDMHNMGERAPYFTETAAWIEKKCGAHRLEQMTSVNPKKILRSELLG